LLYPEGINERSETMSMYAVHRLLSHGIHPMLRAADYVLCAEQDI